MWADFTVDNDKSWWSDRQKAFILVNVYKSKAVCESLCLFDALE